MCYINYIPVENGTHFPPNYRTNNFFHKMVWDLFFDHLPNLKLSLCKDTLNLVLLYLNFEMFNIFK